MFLLFFNQFLHTALVFRRDITTKDKISAVDSMLFSRLKYKFLNSTTDIIYVDTI